MQSLSLPGVHQTHFVQQSTGSSAGAAAGVAQEGKHNAELCLKPTGEAGIHKNGHRSAILKVPAHWILLNPVLGRGEGGCR